jgi:DNA-binding transcriptional LysR family regulator
MDWDNLRIFLAVARVGQFVAAAKQLRIDHATVGRRITALEQSLNAKLFERSTTGVSLTEAGIRLLTSSERIESEWLQTQADLSDTNVELAGTVRIGAPDGLSTYYLARCFKEFCDKHPDITIQLVPMPQVMMLNKREVDIVVTLEKPDSGRFVTRKLTNYSLGIYGAKTYFEAHSTPQTQEDLLQHRLIGYVEDYAFLSALDYVRELYSGAKPSFECASAVGQLEAIKCGMGLGVAHDYIAHQHPDLIKVLPERSATRSYWIVIHEDMRGLGRIKAVYNHMVTKIEQDRHIFAK